MVTKWEIYSDFTANNILLAFQMDQNGTFPENYKYDHWILHKKLVFTLFITNFHGHTIVNPNTTEYPDPEDPLDQLLY